MTSAGYLRSSIESWSPDSSFTRSRVRRMLKMKLSNEAEEGVEGMGSFEFLPLISINILRSLVGQVSRIKTGQD